MSGAMRRSLAYWSKRAREQAEPLRRRRGAASHPSAPRGLLEFWENNHLSVQVFEQEAQGVRVLHLMVRRNDEKPLRDWRTLQDVKNTVAGPERVAVEVFPPESELVDQANIYHLWVYPAGHRLPFGLAAGSGGPR